MQVLKLNEPIFVSGLTLCSFAIDAAAVQQTFSTDRTWERKARITETETTFLVNCTSMSADELDERGRDYLGEFVNEHVADKEEYLLPVVDDYAFEQKLDTLLRTADILIDREDMELFGLCEVLTLDENREIDFLAYNLLFENEGQLRVLTATLINDRYRVQDGKLYSSSNVVSAKAELVGNSINRVGITLMRDVLGIETRATDLENYGMFYLSANYLQQADQPTRLAYNFVMESVNEDGFAAPKAKSQIYRAVKDRIRSTADPAQLTYSDMEFSGDPCLIPSTVPYETYYAAEDGADEADDGLMVVYSQMTPDFALPGSRFTEQPVSSLVQTLLLQVVFDEYGASIDASSHYARFDPAFHSVSVDDDIIEQLEGAVYRPAILAFINHPLVQAGIFPYTDEEESDEAEQQEQQLVAHRQQCLQRTLEVFTQNYGKE